MAEKAKKKKEEVKETFEEKKIREANEACMSEAVSRLYRDKHQFDNSKNTKR